MLSNIEITGFKGKIEDVNKTLDEVEKIKNSCCDGGIIQLINSEGIGGKKHLEHSIIQAIKAFERKNNLANDLGIEILLRASGQRQISKAFNILGLKTGEMEIAIILIDCPDYYIDELSKIFQRDDSVLEGNPSKIKEIYGISEKELELYRLTDILIDRTTALIVEM